MPGSPRSALRMRSTTESSSGCLGWYDRAGSAGACSAGARTSPRGATLLERARDEYERQSLDELVAS